MKKQVALVEITQFGSDKAVFVNGEYVASADPSCGDSAELIEQVSQSLAVLNGVEVDRIYHAAHEDWQWDEIQSCLQDSGKLVGAFKTYSFDHTYIDSEGEEHNETIEFDAQSYSEAVRKLIDFYRPMSSRLVRINNVLNEEVAVLHQTGESDYHLMPQTSSSCWITVGSASVYVKQEGEGVVVDIYPLNGEANESVASTYAHFTECLPETA